MPSQVGPTEQEIPVGISLGIVVADVRHKAPEALLNDADQALYGGKRNGKDQFAVFH